MSDEERIARLTELAQRVAEWQEEWPDDAYPYEVAVGWNSAAVQIDGNDMLVIDGHSRALDALEAALLVLAGEPHAWAEQLASELEQRANRLEAQRVYGKAYALREVAAELRERARRT